ASDSRARRGVHNGKRAAAIGVHPLTGYVRLCAQQSRIGQLHACSLRLSQLTPTPRPACVSTLTWRRRTNWRVSSCATGALGEGSRLPGIVLQRLAATGKSVLAATCRRGSPSP